MARRRLQHIIRMSEHEHITVLVIPFAAGAFPAAGQTVMYAHGPVVQLDTVQLDTAMGPLFLTAEAQLDKYRTILDRHETRALQPQASREFVNAVVRDL
ncbi:helix-turn-helix domain protein [Streptantibioticus cattleyicolor NRRL 8057 = DSM 46488]|uniref:Helix-turn-helix domain protein n=1 Tax=Streptantibioticus cattleyicolor (strain ATCC 35852 / DSM 46488 / JCM 4925 / NBRC 14057 / NRRL 8057) TaxID=1003195 RepID=G8WSZ5_STREN|nr:helix-turn-helix domain protein [Streptantibioticus cattleyicolor NRRL 8057 = DSM 46488]